MAIDQHLLTFAARHNLGSLATIKADGRPQLSNVNYHLDGTLLRISVTDNRAKVVNLRRDPRASILVQGDGGWSYAVLEGTVSLTAVAQSPGDETVEELVELFRSIRGEDHSDWDEYREAMVNDDRLVARLRVEHTYGMVG